MTITSRLWLEEAPRDELVELLELLDERFDNSRVLRPPWPPRYHWFCTPGTHGPTCSPRSRLGAGVKPRRLARGLDRRRRTSEYDAFFVDLQKAERDYSPTTMYRDYAINRELFHWESQSTQTAQQRRVRRWIEHQERGGNVLLFVRDKKRSELGTQPFTFLGPVTYVEHRGRAASRLHMAATPIPMPEELFEVARSVAAA